MRLVLALSLALCGCATPRPSGLPAPNELRTGADVVRAAHCRWSGVRAPTLTFVQQTVVHRPGALRDTSTWYEALGAPGQLRIDVAPLSGETAYFWTGGVRTVVQGGAVADRRPDVNVLLVALWDLYRQPPAATLAVLDSLGVDTAALGEATFQGRPVLTVGTATADTAASAVWFDRERFVPVRIVQRPLSGGPLLDAHVSGYTQIEGAWHETRIDLFLNGRLFQEEVYRDVRPGAELPEGLFDPAAVPPPVRYWESATRD